MSTVLILSVGGSLEPIVNAINQNQPDFVYFLCSSGDDKRASEKQIPDIVKQTSLLDDSYKIISTEMPDDLNSVLEKCAAIEADIKQMFQPNCRIMANYTGGTKTMTLGLGVYTLLRSPDWELQANIGPRQNTQKVSTGDVAQRLDLSYFYYQTLLDGIEKNIESTHYELAITLLEQYLARVTLATGIRNELTDKLNYLKMLAAWDRLDYTRAKTYADILNDTPHVTRFRKLKRITSFFENREQIEWGVYDVSGQELVEDLLENAQKCAKRQRYDDAAGRLYRATELCAQIKLLRDYSINTGSVHLDHECLPQKTKQWLQSKNNNKEEIKTALMDSYAILYDLDDPLGRYWHENQTELKKYIDKRNQSLIAHGLTPITQPDWHAIGEGWHTWLQGGIEKLKR